MNEFHQKECNDCNDAKYKNDDPNDRGYKYHWLFNIHNK